MIVLNSKIKSFNLKDDRFIHHLFDKLKASKKKYILNVMTKPILNQAMNEITQYKLIFKALLEYQSLDEIQNSIS